MGGVKVKTNRGDFGSYMQGSSQWTSEDLLQLECITVPSILPENTLKRTTTVDANNDWLSKHQTTTTVGTQCMASA
jgi:hypothetical protein